MSSKKHDIAAENAPLKKKKKSRLDAAMQELSEANSSNALLAEKLAKAQETIRSLQTSLTSARSECGDVNSVEFENELGPSSTKQPSAQRSEVVELSRFVSSMNQMSVSSINVPECKASVEGEDISRLDFDAWRDLLSNSLTLAGITDETTQFVVFKVKAGQKLLELFRATESTTDAPNEKAKPYSNAMFRLKKYFASTSDVMLQRRKLALMTQNHSESDLTFIRRVSLAAKQCEYPEGKQLEEVLSTVAEQAKHKEVRVAALKMMSRKGTLADFIDKVREIETIRLNEEYVSKKQSVVSSASVNAVQAVAGPSRYVPTRTTPAYGRTPVQRSNIRGGRIQRPVRGSVVWRGSSSRIPERCTRCNSIYHATERCFAVNMTCHNCGGVGHLLRACNLPVTTRGKVQVGRNRNDALEVAAVGTKPEAQPDEEIPQEPVSEIKN
ncbi:uncharacterized protein LOC134285213 [Aedes albopictus]|uniref:CCHC-type domain-containing protein n=1 Tax=Aedes albopictus TaxID=7160 RepID=A0ABM1XXJ7_AEDAL